MLLLLKLVHVVPLGTPHHIDIFSRDARFLVKLDIRDFLVSQHDRHFQIKVDQHNELVGSAWLEEAVLDIREAHIDLCEVLLHAGFQSHLNSLV